MRTFLDCLPCFFPKPIFSGKGPLFFLLIATCGGIAHNMGVQEGDIVLKGI